MKNNSVKQGYYSSFINKHLERISLLNRINLITEKDTPGKSDRIPLLITYNKFLPKYYPNHGRYFTLQIVRQTMPFFLWSVQYAAYSISLKTRHYSTLD